MRLSDKAFPSLYQLTPPTPHTDHGATHIHVCITSWYRVYVSLLGKYEMCPAQLVTTVWHLGQWMSHDQHLRVNLEWWVLLQTFIQTSCTWSLEEWNEASEQRDDTAFPRRGNMAVLRVYGLRSAGHGVDEVRTCFLSQTSLWSGIWSAPSRGRCGLSGTPPPAATADHTPASAPPWGTM